MTLINKITFLMVFSMMAQAALASEFVFNFQEKYVQTSPIHFKRVRTERRRSDLFPKVEGCRNAQVDHFDVLYWGQMFKLHMMNTYNESLKIVAPTNAFVDKSIFSEHCEMPDDYDIDEEVVKRLRVHPLFNVEASIEFTGLDFKGSGLVAVGQIKTKIPPIFQPKDYFPTGPLRVGMHFGSIKCVDSFGRSLTSTNGEEQTAEDIIASLRRRIKVERLCTGVVCGWDC
ncbi:MAG: hypothetical protein R2827_14460 [Bdellovibrionales bacterium]